MLLDEFMAILNRILRRFPGMQFPDELKRMIWRWYVELLTLSFLQVYERDTSRYDQDTCRIHRNTSGYVSDRNPPPKRIGNPTSPPVGGGRRPSRRWDDFRVRVTVDSMRSIQMVNIENVSEFVPILFAARSLSQPVNSEITKIHEAVLY
jgi:hypothetical protein